MEFFLLMLNIVSVLKIIRYSEGGLDYQMTINNFSKLLRTSWGT